MSLAEKLSSAISNLDINNVFMTGAEIKLMIHPSNIKPENTLVDFEDSVTWTMNTAGDLLLCQVQRILKGIYKEVPDAAEQKEVLTIKVSFNVQYSLKDPEKKADSHTYEVFAKTNAVYNSYPYFREFIHSTCTRMGIQPIVLSFLKPYTMKQVLELFPEPSASLETTTIKP